LTYLVDATVLSEPTMPAPRSAVAAWLRKNERDIVVDRSSSGRSDSAFIFSRPAGAANDWRSGSDRA
jgi:hypothetical protein